MRLPLTALGGRGTVWVAELIAVNCFDDCLRVRNAMQTEPLPH